MSVIRQTSFVLTTARDLALGRMVLPERRAGGPDIAVPGTPCQRLQMEWLDGVTGSIIEGRL
jgi:hypothetical protein